MGSSKKHKEKDKDKDKEKKSRKRKHSDEEEASNGDSTKHGTKEKVKDKDREKSHKEHKKKHKEKRKHSAGSDSDAPVAKSSKKAGHDSESRVREHEREKSPPMPTSTGNNSSLSVEDTNRWRLKLGLAPLQEKGSGKKPVPRKRSPSPDVSSSGGGGNESLSIDETNKLRIKLGLKPLETGSRNPPQQREREKPEHHEAEEGELDESTIQRIREEREQEGETFWKEKQDFVHAPPENISKQRKEEQIRDKIHNQREKRRLEEKLMKTKGLADDSDDDVDAAKWVEKSKKLAEQKALAEKRAKALEELDDEFGVGDLVTSEFQKVKNRAYDSKNLKGLKVMHSEHRIAEGESVIMTLQDKDVLAEDDDVLVNVNMIDDEKFEKNLKDRKLRPELHGYNVFDELGGFDEDGTPQEKKVLSKYDEEINGIEKKAFVIGEDRSEEARQAKIRAKMQKANKILESISAPGLNIASDFFTSDEMSSFKTRKKKVRKVRKSQPLRADDLLKDTDSAPLVSNREKDLGSRHKSKHSEDVKVKPEPTDMEIDMEVDDLPPAQAVDVSDIKIEDEGDLDFQLALSKARKLKQKKAVVLQSGERMAELLRSDRGLTEAHQAGSVTLHATAEFCRTLGDIPSFEAGDIYADQEMDFETEEQEHHGEVEERGTWNAVEIDETPVDITREPEIEAAPILQQEPEIGSGIAGALRLAVTKGYLEAEKARPSAPAKMKHLEAKNYSIEDKNYEDERTPSKRDMYSGPVTDFKEKESYKPDVKLEYNDDEGQPISSKEAFRLLSHKFHGKGSGKNKIDKKRRKVDQEKLMQHMSSTDTPLGTLELLQERQKLSHSPYIVLTGNKAAQNAAFSKLSKR